MSRYVERKSWRFFLERWFARVPSPPLSIADLMKAREICRVNFLGAAIRYVAIGEGLLEERRKSENGVYGTRTRGL